MPVPSNQSGPMFANKKEYTPAEIRDNFIAINEELKKNGYTYYQLPSAGLMQIWDNGKLVPYYPDMANTAYPAVEGPKGSITDYKNPNFDEALLRKFMDAKSLSDQLQQGISSSVRGALASATDPNKVDASAIVAGIYNSPNGGGKGITLNPNNPQLKASSLKISSELKKANAPINQYYRKPPSIDTDGLSVEAVRNNDADSLVALRKVWGAQPAAPDTGLDPKSDEYQYLAAKRGIDTAERMSAGAYKSTVAEKKEELKTYWANFKANNDELKARGYDYYEAKDGKYGTDVLAYRNTGEYLNKVEGPKGNVNLVYSTNSDGIIVNPIGNPNSPQFDKQLKAISSGENLQGLAYHGLEAAQKFEDLRDKLTAEGVDLVKLEADNPHADGVNGGMDTFGAKPSTGTNLPQTAGTQNPYDIVGLSAEAAKGIIGLPEKKLGGHNGSNPLQATVSNPSVPVPGTNIGQYIDHIQAQTNAMNAGTWKPSDGYYFSSPNGVGFDPTGTLKAIVDSHPLMNGNNAPNPDNQQALKDAGYSYMTGPQNDTMVVGPKGPYNVGWTTDPAKKGDYQKDLEKLWASTGVTFSGQTSMPATATTNYVQPSVTANESLVASRTDNLSQNPVSKSIDKSGNLVAQASIAGSSLPGTTNAVPYVAPAVNPVAEKLSGSKRSASGGGTNGTPINGGFGPDPTGGLGVWPPTNTPKFTQ